MRERARRLTRATRIELERDRNVPVRTRCNEATVVSPRIRQLAALDWTLARTSAPARFDFDSAPPPSLETTDLRGRRHEGTDELLGREGDAFPLDRHSAIRREPRYVLGAESRGAAPQREAKMEYEAGTRMRSDFAACGREEQEWLTR